jgi:dTDP-4-amino-4,6-dideoxygalactose transaminase
MIPVFKPKIRTEEILSELKSVLDSGWIGLGPKVKEFEELIKNHLKCDYVVGTNSCTSSIHIALKAINRNNKKKYVISTPMTFVSTNHCILYENQQPIFCDIEPTTGVIDPQSFEEACMKYGNDINAAIIVHIAGYSAEMNEINKIADKYGIKIIEDCAHAFGGRYNQKMIGEDSQNIHCWSFQAVKNMPIGDGGAISTSDPELDCCSKIAWAWSKLMPSGPLRLNALPPGSVKLKVLILFSLFQLQQEQTLLLVAVQGRLPLDLLLHPLLCCDKDKVRVWGLG